MNAPLPPVIVVEKNWSGRMPTGLSLQCSLSNGQTLLVEHDDTYAFTQLVLMDISGVEEVTTPQVPLPHDVVMALRLEVQLAAEAWREENPDAYDSYDCDGEVMR